MLYFNKTKIIQVFPFLKFSYVFMPFIFRLVIYQQESAFPLTSPPHPRERPCKPDNKARVDNQLYITGYPGQPMSGLAKPDKENISWVC